MPRRQPRNIANKPCLKWRRRSTKLKRSDNSKAKSRRRKWTKKSSKKAICYWQVFACTGVSICLFVFVFLFFWWLPQQLKLIFVVSVFIVMSCKGKREKRQSQFRQLEMLNQLLNTLSPNSDKHLISPYSITT